jgi:hypothetical protein
VDLFAYYDELIASTGDSSPVDCEPAFTNIENMLLTKLSSRGAIHTRMKGGDVYCDRIPYIKKMVELDMREDVVEEEEDDGGSRRRLRRGGRKQEKRKHFAGIIDLEDLKENRKTSY